eukprot:7591358-Lingulodinium_polyedra.AAC.1
MDKNGTSPKPRTRTMRHTSPSSYSLEGWPRRPGAAIRRRGVSCTAANDATTPTSAWSGGP